MQAGAVEPARLERLHERLQRTVGRLRVAAWLDAKVELVGLEPGSVRANLAEQLDQLRRARSALSCGTTTLPKRLRLPALSMAPSFMLVDHALATREEKVGRKACFEGVRELSE